jgi:hypothetical protein
MMSIKLNTTLNDEVSHSPSTVALSGERTKPPAQAMNLQAVAQKLPKLRKTVAKIMASLALSSVFALVPMVAQARPIMTWNLNGATNGGQQSWEKIFDTMNAPGRVAQPINVAAIQEAGRPNGLRRLRQVGTIPSNGGTIAVYEIERGGATFRIYWTLGDLGATTRNALAIVLRNPVPGLDTRPVFVPNPNGPFIQGENVALDRNRPALGVRDTNGAYYFTFHATATGNVNNDAAQLANAAVLAANADNGGGVPDVFNGADVNRDLANTETAFPGDLNQGRVIPPDQLTFNARTLNPTLRLDGFIVRRTNFNTGQDNANLIAPGLTLNNFGDAFTPQFASDHFAVLLEDGYPSNESVTNSRLDRGRDGRGFTIIDRAPENGTRPEPQCQEFDACGQRISSCNVPIECQRKGKGK